MKIECIFEVLPFATYSMQQSGLNFINQLIIKNVDLDTIENLDVELIFSNNFAEKLTKKINQLSNSEPYDLSNINIKIDNDFFCNRQETSNENIELLIKKDDNILFSQSKEILILPFDHWVGPIMPILSASFVTPRNKKIPAIIQAASQYLEKWTGSTSFTGYQSGNKQIVKMQAAAIFSAIKSYNILYTDTADFEVIGQRIRLADELLESKMGHCVDMSLLFCSALESIGLHPIIITISGHMFAGLWLENNCFCEPVFDDVSMLTKRIADGINEIIVVECTAMNASDKQLDFDKAVEIASNNLNPIDFQWFVDVHRARFAPIRPLPNRIIENGKFEIEQIELDNYQTPKEIKASEIFVEDEKIVATKQMVWERKLLDLSLRNSLINTRMGKNLLPLIGENIATIEDMLWDGKEFQILPVSNSINKDLVIEEINNQRIYSPLKDDEVKYSLTSLYRNSKLSLEESGVNTLYIAIGFLQWFETPKSEKARIAPLILIPIEIIRKSAKLGYVIRSRDEETIFNITLLEMLRQFYNLNISGLNPLPTDEKGVDVAKILNIVRHHIKEKERWDVIEQVALGNFSFSKFVMWNDIHNNQAILEKNPIVKALIDGNALSIDDSEIENTDNNFNAMDFALPISADSSQLKAIIEAGQGKSFILHGPPGTGKSQTITNMIANALFNDKKVLFVAEKAAALEVVQTRLQKIGLAPFCLELHSNKSKKTAVLEQLKQTTEILKKKSPAEYQNTALELDNLKRTFASHIEKLHKKYPFGYSLYDLMQRYTEFSQDEKEFEFTNKDLLLIDKGQLIELENCVLEYQTACKIIGNLANCPVKEVQTSNIDNINQAKNLLEELTSQIKIQKQFFEKLEINNISNQDQYNDIIKLIDQINKIEIVFEDLFSSQDSLCFERTYQTISMQKQINETQKNIIKNYNIEILKDNLKELELKWKNSFGQNFISKFFAQNKVVKMLEFYKKPGYKISKDEITSLFNSIKNYHEIDNQLEECKKECSKEVVNLMNQKYDFDKLENQILITKQIKDICQKLNQQNLGNNQINKKISYLIQNKIDNIKDIFDNFLGKYDNVQKLLELNIDQSKKYDIFYLGDILDRIFGNFNLLREKCTYNIQRKKMLNLGLYDFVSNIENGAIVNNFENCFRKSLFKFLIETIIFKENLSGFYGQMFETKIQRFKTLCKEFETLTQKQLYAKLASKIPSFQNQANKASEVGKLQRYIRNNGRGISLRTIFNELFDLLTSMCPCMLMSPASVAQYLKAGDNCFDIIIFDEASQMPTSQAIGAIARGKSLIVAGDTKQMPPTNFFSSSTFDEDNPDIEDLESILDDCLALRLPSRHLLWHYRSKHESLISFSNINYYNSELLTFPSIEDRKSKITFVKVDGIYDRGKTRQNYAEAVMVVQEIKNRLLDPELRQKSIGVITFNTNQQSLIEDLFGKMLEQNPQIDKYNSELKEPVFIKNLETVQGDERDVILFSVGFGSDQEGKVTLNFGPLNRQGGQRRLNVAISRARYQMVVYSSLTADMIDLNRTKSEGIKDLKNFLAYAQNGKSVLSKIAAKIDIAPNDGIINKIVEYLKSHNYNCDINIGSSGYKVDIGIINPDKSNEYLCAIIIDGYNYSKSETVVDRDIIQPQILKLLGWRIIKIWSLDYYLNPEKTLETLLENIEKAKSEIIDNQEIEDNNQSKEEEEEETIQEDEIIPQEDNPQKEYQTCIIDSTDLSNYGSPADILINIEKYHTILKDRIFSVVSTESPISEKNLYKKVLQSFGISRTGNRLNEFMKSMIMPFHFASTQSEDCTFYWNISPYTYTDFRTNGNRDALDIAPQEIINGIQYILKSQGSMDYQALETETARIFGFARLGDNVRKVVKFAIDKAVYTNKIILNDNLYKA